MWKHLAWHLNVNRHWRVSGLFFFFFFKLNTNFVLFTVLTVRPNLIHRPQHYPQRFKDSMGDILEAHLFACLRLGDWALDVQPAIALPVQKAWKQLLSPFHQGVTLISSNSTLGWLDLGDSHVGWRGEVTSDRSRRATQLWGRAPGELLMMPSIGEARQGETTRHFRGRTDLWGAEPYFHWIWGR